MFRALVVNAVIVGALYAADDLSAQSVKSIREVSINLHVKNADLLEVFQSIEIKTGFQFTYKTEDLDQQVKISGSFKNLSVASILMEISKQSRLQFRQINDNIHVTRRTGKNDPLVLSDTQQGRMVTGKIVSAEDSEGLPGVNVIVKGTTTGTVTDVNGRYSIEVPSSESMLVYSSVGYIKEEVAVGNRTVIDLTLSPDITALEEIVVVGYGEVKKGDLSGAVAQVSADDLTDMAAVSIDQALKGRLAGVHVVQSSGQPGAGMDIYIRGSNSTGSSRPLYVIDGYPIEIDLGANGSNAFETETPQVNPLANINPNDIKSIEILKDASSTAIYGSRGANGVVLITTKSGSKGPGRNNLTYNYKFDLSELPTSIDVLDTRDFMNFRNEGWLNDSIDGTATGKIPYTPSKIDSLVAANPNTNWQELLYGSAQTHNHNLRFYGGTQSDNFSISLNYLNSDGIIRNSTYDRFTFRVNANRKINDRLKVGTNTFYTHSKTGLASHASAGGFIFNSVVLGALTFRPLDVPFNPDGEVDDDLANNPYTLTDLKQDDLIYNTFNTQVNAQWEFIDGLYLDVKAGLISATAERNVYWPKRGTYQGESANGSATFSLRKNFNYLGDALLRYQKNIKKHNINAVTGITYQNWQNRSIQQQSIDFFTDLLGYNQLTVANTPGKMINNNALSALFSWIGRVNYVYDSKYIFTFTNRYDGSSRLAEGEKYRYYPSVALAYNLGNEEFFKDAVPAISDLKLRLSWGLSGNQSIAPYSTLPQMTADATGYPINGTMVTPLYPVSFGNPLLTWETTEQWNAGMNMSLFEGRIAFGVDYYDKLTDNLLIGLNIPISSGYYNYNTNFGMVRNRGIEVEVNAHIIDKQFKWDANATFSHNRNTLEDLGDLTELYGRTFISDGNYVANQNVSVSRVGEPLGSFIVYQANGIYQTQEQINAATSISERAKKPGDIIIADLNQDSVINTDDRYIAGNPQPDFIFGFGSNFSYKSFSLDVFVNGMFGNEIVNLNDYMITGNRSQGQSNMTQEAYDNAWRGEGTSNRYPSISNGQRSLPYEGKFYDWFVQDGSYVRLQSVTLSYNVPSKNIKWMENLRIFAGATNLLTWTNYEGYDPESSAFSNGSAIDAGIDLGTFPIPRTYTLGIDVTF
jgi:TonB-linked SusC/RagA family outer membrane protein